MVPKYSIGVPFNLICNENFCYLDYDEAYKNKGKADKLSDRQRAEMQGRGNGYF